jgi:hypothetical protein
MLSTLEVGSVISIEIFGLAVVLWLVNRHPCFKVLGMTTLQKAARNFMEVSRWNIP